MTRYRFTQAQRRQGGKTTATRPGGTCTRCGLHFKTHPRYAGHMGLHGLADRHTGGDLAAARKLLVHMGQAAGDPIPGNGAFAAAHRAYQTVLAKKD